MTSSRTKRAKDVYEQLGEIPEHLAGACVHVCVPDFPYVPVIDVKHEPNDPRDGDPGVVLLMLDPDSEFMQELDRLIVQELANRVDVPPDDAGVVLNRREVSFVGKLTNSTLNPIQSGHFGGLCFKDVSDRIRDLLTTGSGWPTSNVLDVRHVFHYLGAKPGDGKRYRVTLRVEELA